MITLDTGKFTALTQDQADSFWPVWSPDGKHIAYTSNLEGNYDLWMIAFPEGEKIRLTSSSAYDGEPSWSPDGKGNRVRIQPDGAQRVMDRIRGGKKRTSINRHETYMRVSMLG